jgi:Transglycosylase SLT domain
MVTRRDFHKGLLSTCGISVIGVGASAHASAKHPIPEGYEIVAREFNMPSVILFGVAVQESSMSFGKKGQRIVLPWPWTLNAYGRGYRFATRVAAYEGLMQLRRGGKSLIDIGPMQVNWHYFNRRLISEYQALEPYHNLRVGASILHDLFKAERNWVVAVGKYHSPGNAVRASKYRQQMFSRLKQLGYLNV